MNAQEIYDFCVENAHCKKYDEAYAITPEYMKPGWQVPTPEHKALIVTLINGNSVGTVVKTVEITHSFRYTGDADLIFPLELQSSTVVVAPNKFTQSLYELDLLPLCLTQLVLLFLNEPIAHISIAINSTPIFTAPVFQLPYIFPKVVAGIPMKGYHCVEVRITHNTEKKHAYNFKYRAMICTFSWMMTLLPGKYTTPWGRFSNCFCYLRTSLN